MSILDEIHAKREEICAVAKRRERQVIADPALNFSVRISEQQSTKGKRQ